MLPHNEEVPNRTKKWRSWGWGSRVLRKCISDGSKSEAKEGGEEEFSANIITIGIHQLN